MLPGKENELVFKGPITRWDEAVPLGNGMSGCLLWGDGQTLRLSLDRGDLWETTPCPTTLREDFTYETMLRLVREKGWEELKTLFEAPYDCPYPTKLPAGKILLHFGPCSKMETRLCLDDATAQMQLELPEGALSVQAFLHAETGIGYLWMDRLPGDFSFEVCWPDYSFADEKKLPDIQMDSLATCGLDAFTYPHPQRLQAADQDGFVLQISDQLSYCAAAHLHRSGQGALLVWCIDTAANGESLAEAVLSRLEKAAADLPQALRSHTDWWHGYWEKSGVRISDKLFEKNWYISQYLLGACSHKGCPPMPLQGVWTADNDSLPPWKGDYHHDLNTQLSYYPYLKANRLDAGESFLDYLWSLVPQAREFARRFYHADGICLPTVMSIDAQPMCGWPMYSLAPASQIWLCQSFERHYRYTGDRDFLVQRAYPYMKETARFMLCILQEGADGMLRLPVSASPEIHDNTHAAWVTPNSNYDLSLLHYLFEQLLELSALVCPEDGELWHSVLEKLPPLAVNEKGVYRVSPDEDLCESHRHFSHLMAIHPLRLTKYDTEENRRIIDACILNLELLGTGLWVGFSFAWMAELYAIQGNGEGAATQLEIFWRYCCSPNGFHLNGDYKRGGFTTWHYRPFTLEGNMCAADALQEMLLFSEGNTLRLFPAIPERFETAEFENFRAQNGLLVSAKQQGGRIAQVSIQAQQPCTVTLEKGAEMPVTCHGLPCKQVSCENGDLLLCFG